ncbi:DNA-binding MarR family transcriptional regulator [Antricoccus suffuscus]|uniref:DNA-binding MarR family transcriptional regulator n=2 Tax=Antricoccus suffuscus TaxID=1629062 RepID=A0A2T0ZZC9_9ACTN|nr:DNA-binding MarR family transcriptional regulator [Antricoccus suffuscus]
MALADGLDRLILWGRRYAPVMVSSTTVTTLDTLRTDGPLRISALAVRESVSQPGMTTLVNRLEAAGHAERYPDPHDGRASLVRITDAGRKLLADRHTTRTRSLLGPIERLDSADRAALMAALPALERLINMPMTTE